MRSHAAPARFGVLTIRNQLHSGLWPGHQGKRAPPQNGPGLFFPALPRLIALVGNEWAPGSLGKQPAAPFPSPCSAGYPGRSREWLRPRLFGGSPRQFSGACLARPARIRFAGQRLPYHQNARTRRARGDRGKCRTNSSLHAIGSLELPMVALLASRV